MMVIKVCGPLVLGVSVPIAGTSVVRIEYIWMRASDNFGGGVPGFLQGTKAEFPVAGLMPSH